MAILVPTYWVTYGLSNFLWYSDVILFLAFFATLFESRLLASMSACGGLVLSLLWLISIFYALLLGTDHYMLDSSTSIWVRGISLFHVVLPFLLLWLVWKLGYHKRGWIFQVILTWLLAFTTWLLTDRAENINFVFLYEKMGVNPYLYLVGLAGSVSIIVYLTHLFLLRLFRRRDMADQ